MSKVGKFMLKETTRTSLTLANFLILIGTVVTVVYAGTMWKAQMEAENDKIRSEIAVVRTYQAEDRVKIEKLEAVSVDTKTSLAEIQTDLKWIRAYMEDR